MLFLKIKNNQIHYKKKFALLWKSILANDFLNKNIRYEYNESKTWFFRIIPGGIGIEIGLQNAPDIPAPPEIYEIYSE
jgi:hypothetical protein